ncbi:MAG: HD domain-containing protein [Planctomycetota bacterium]
MPTSCLLQFNEYHKYTVDEHTFVMVQEVEKLANQESLPGRVFCAALSGDLLMLAILLHDLGKGFAEDHSEVGKRIAEQVAERFRLSESDSNVLVFLVHKHLFLSNLAYRRDTSDPALGSARVVGSIEMRHALRPHRRG